MGSGAKIVNEAPLPQKSTTYKFYLANIINNVCHLYKYVHNIIIKNNKINSKLYINFATVYTFILYSQYLEKLLSTKKPLVIKKYTN